MPNAKKTSKEETKELAAEPMHEGKKSQFNRYASDISAKELAGEGVRKEIGKLKKLSDEETLGSGKEAGKKGLVERLKGGAETIAERLSGLSIVTDKTARLHYDLGNGIGPAIVGGIVGYIAGVYAAVFPDMPILGWWLQQLPNPLLSVPLLFAAGGAALGLLGGGIARD